MYFCSALNFDSIGFFACTKNWIRVFSRLGCPKLERYGYFTKGSLSVSVNSTMAAEQEVIAEKEVQRQVEILTATHDEFDGVTVEMNEKMESTVFVSILKASISHWRREVVFFF